jgi:hypothetical protein
VIRGRTPPSWLAWVLCWLSLGLLAAGAALRIAFPLRADDAVFYVTVSSLSTALVPLVGGLIAARLPTNPYGWLWCLGGLTFGVFALGDGLRRSGAVDARLAGALVAAAYVTGVCLFPLILVLFPTGRLPGRPWRWVAGTAVLSAAIGLLAVPFAESTVERDPTSPGGLGATTGNPADDVFGYAVTVALVLLLPAVASLLVRFRRAGPVERQQLKWFFLAAGLGAVMTLVGGLDLPIDPAVWSFVDAVTTGLLPLAVGIAVLRYRLYEIDRLISRSVSYGALTAVLIGLYLLVVTLLRPLLEPVTGNSSLAVAASTLAVAAVFNPARRRLQTAVDRRFDRARYDAARAVDAFAARLRNQVDLDEVTAGLRDTVVATVAPTRVGVWLRLPSTAVEP